MGKALEQVLGVPGLSNGPAADEQLCSSTPRAPGSGGFGFPPRRDEGTIQNYAEYTKGDFQQPEPLGCRQTQLGRAPNPTAMGLLGQGLPSSPLVAQGDSMGIPHCQAGTPHQHLPLDWDTSPGAEPD